MFKSTLLVNLEISRPSGTIFTTGLLISLPSIDFPVPSLLVVAGAPAKITRLRQPSSTPFLVIASLIKSQLMLFPGTAQLLIRLRQYGVEYQRHA